MVILEVVFLIVFWAWLFAACLFLRNTVLPRVPIFQTPEQFELQAETVEFHATDGLRLQGWKIPGDPDRSWILLCHGLGANRADLLDVAAGLHTAGFNLLLFDFRGHGGSAGRVTSFGWREQRDLEGALAFLSRHPEIPARPYGVYGISMGASVALLVAARDERIGAVAVDSPYTSLQDTLSRHLTLLYPWAPRVPFHWFVLASYLMRYGVWPASVSPQASAAKLAPRPLLLINGAEDPRMPADGARQMYAAAGEPKALWLIQGAGHLEGYAVNPAVYQDRLVRFFDSSLK